MSYAGLCELSLRIWHRVHLASDDAHIEGLLKVVSSHSWSLTTVRIEPYLNGALCLDDPMLDALALCHNLQSLRVCADEARTEVKANNVVSIRIARNVVAKSPGLSDTRDKGGNPILGKNGQPIIGTSLSIDPTRLSPGPIVLESGSGSPVILSREEMNHVIPDKGPMHHACGGCFSCPNAGERQYPRCVGCSTTYYCSQQCQKAHWPQHKAMCKERKTIRAQLKESEEKARLAGQVYYDPRTLTAWYRMHDSAVELPQAYHVLEIFKGPKHLLMATHVAYFELDQSPVGPNDASTVVLRNVVAFERKELKKMVSMSPAKIDVHERSIKSGYMVLFFADVKNGSMCTEMHKVPAQDWIKPADQWMLFFKLKVNGGKKK
ncbi:hypothetical protein IW261DRAFT_1573686 [Armillaria novae-zelandiae]|uniref:MYND-type domain-containing protein n=1 Tax=Armillaria novae-zelandiae TaxID=153914 RepID=A0AA39NMW2_9AGAR|nr:hypothetical protein IW261DRAFT_1573686 [Armillaria novae-zelandiae]